MPKRLLLLTTAGLILTGCQRSAEPSPPEAVGREAERYAFEVGVSLAEATRRLDLQGALGAIGTELEAAELETFGGYWIEHQPSFGGVAAFTRDAQATLGKHLAGRTLPAPVRSVTVRHPLRELLQVQRDVGAALGAAGVAVEGVGIDQRANRVTVLVRDTASARDLLERSGQRLHPSVVFEQGWIETLEGDARRIPPPPPPPPPPR